MSFGKLGVFPSGLKWPPIARTNMVGLSALTDNAPCCITMSCAVLRKSKTRMHVSKDPLLMRVRTWCFTALAGGWIDDP